MSKATVTFYDYDPVPEGVAVKSVKVTIGEAGTRGPAGPPGTSPSGTGLLSVTDGVADSPSTLSARVAADAANLRTQLGLGSAARLDSGAFAQAVHTHTPAQIESGGASNGQILQWNGVSWVPVTYAAGIGGSIGATDNALLRADGAGGATAQGSGVVLDDSSNLTATNWLVGSGIYSGATYARHGAVGTNVSLVLSPTGTGYISANVPDGAATGGNARGTYAVDLQLSRQVGSQVASAGYSFVAGQNNTASQLCAVAMGQNSIASSYVCMALGAFCTAAGSYSVALGSYGVASGAYSLTTGHNAAANKHGQHAHAAGLFGSAGDAQISRMVARVTTTDATPTPILLDGTTGRITVPANSSGRARITVAARRATAGNECMTWTRLVSWHRGVAGSTLTLDVQTIGTDRGYTSGAWGAGPAWSIAITSDTVNGAININATGAAATNIRWVVGIDWTEDTYA